MVTFVADGASEHNGIWTGGRAWAHIRAWAD
jgi:hypothetical protein